MKRWFVFCCVFFLYAVPCSATDKDVAGVINNVNGTATVERSGQVVEAVTGNKIYQKDILQTGPDGSVGVIFRDDTVLSMGPDSRIAIDEFLYSPADGKLSFVSSVSKGTAAFLSGKIAKLSPESVRVETPLAVLGVRGTRFLVAVD